MNRLSLKCGIVSILLVCFSMLFADRTGANTEWKDGILQFSSSDGMFKTRFDVRMYLDGAIYFENENEESMSDGTDLRRVRFAMKVKLWEKWRAEWDMDFATYQKEGDKKNKGPEVKDMWLAYKGWENMMIKVGHFKPPFSMEELTSSSKIVFLERAYPNTFTTGRRIGFGVTYWRNWMHASAGMFGEAAENLDQKSDDEGSAFACRLVAAPLNSDNALLHLGGAFQSITPDAVEDGEEKVLEFDERPETSVSRTKFLDTGDITNVTGYNTIGGELAGKYGPFYAQMEYTLTTVTRKADKDDAEFCGGYAMVGWFITGESKPYDIEEAEFGKPVPESEYGALEIALRYSHLDLTDEDALIYGGMANNYGIALNWYPNNNIRLMVNYIMVENSKYSDGDGDWIGEDDFSFATARVLVNF